jgi:hypothetical protein
MFRNLLWSSFSKDKKLHARRKALVPAAIKRATIRHSKQYGNKFKYNPLIKNQSCLVHNCGITIYPKYNVNDVFCVTTTNKVKRCIENMTEDLQKSSISCLAFLDEWMYIFLNMPQSMIFDRPNDTFEWATKIQTRIDIVLTVNYFLK